MTVAEIIAELTYAGKTLAEIARIDDIQMRWIFCRKRDRNGNLTRRDPELPDWVEVDADGMRVVNNPVPFTAMFKQVKKYQGLDEAGTKQAWQGYIADNPKLAKVAF